MFEKLLANLPYNPGLTKQIGFYAGRMRQEKSVRRIGLLFIVLAFMVQFFAFVSPPQSTAAYSSSDMINGGFSKQSDAVAACRNNDKNYGDALWNFGISCNEVANMTVTTIRPDQDNNQLFSMGWLSYGQNNPVTGKATDQVSYNLAKISETLYAQRHSSFYGGSNVSASYKALQGKTDDGKTFWILFGCGNLVFIGVPVPHKVCPYNSNLLANDNQCFKPCQYDKSIPATSSKCFKPCEYNTSIPAGSSQCFKPCPISGLSGIPQSSPKCVAPCPYNKNISSNSDKCFKPCQYNKNVPAGSAQCFKPCQYNKSISATSPQCFPPCPYNGSISRTDSKCKPCSAALSSENAIACVVEHKTASNITENKADANGTTAQPNDVIVYTLSATNKGKATVSKFVMSENLSDVLDYATITDLGGGTMGANNQISWPATNIKAGATLTHKIAVRVKDPVPTTTPSVDNPNDFDHIMTNVYGNTININLPTPPGTPVVTASESLPNTGPGAGLVIAGLLVVVAGYFFARSRLLADESVIAVQEATGGRL